MKQKSFMIIFDKSSRYSYGDVMSCCV